MRVELAEPRICGIESEYALVMSDRDGDLNTNGLIDFAWKDGFWKTQIHPEVYWTPSIHNSHGGFIQNGGRYYLDYHDYPEVASPECVSFQDAVTYDIAGDEMVGQHFANIVNAGYLSRVLISKRSVDYDGNTCGAHENYATHSDIWWSESQIRMNEVFGELASFLVSRAVWSGAGSLDSKGTYHMTQKMRSLKSLSGLSTTEKKPIVNTRHENHGSVGRLHITSGDHNISPWATWMKLAITSVAMRLIEAGVYPDEAIMNNPLIAAGELTTGTELDKLTENVQGKKLSLINYQEIFLERTEQVRKLVQLPAEEEAALEELATVLEDLSISPDTCSDRVDWVARQQLVEAKSAASDRKRADLAYCLLRYYDANGIDRSGWGVNARAKGAFRKAPNRDSVERALQHAPENTRAHIRSHITRALSTEAPTRDFSVGWDYVSVPSSTFFLKDVQEYQLDRANQWLNSIA